MKKISFLLVLSVLSAASFQSCRKASTESEFTEFEIESADGALRSGGIYLPKGISPKDRLPVIYMADGLIFKECGFKKMMDSLVENKSISPVVIACSFENKKTIPNYNLAYRNAEYVEALARNDNNLARLFENHYNYFIKEFIPYVEKKVNVSDSRDERIFFGTSNSADFGITLSLRNPALIAEYWCYSPVYSEIKDYGLISTPTTYMVCWGAKEEIGKDDYFADLMKDIRKRGGTVHSWVYNGGHDREWWKYWFSEELKRRFPYSK